jgi:hypothetical protein
MLYYIPQPLETVYHQSNRMIGNCNSTKSGDHALEATVPCNSTHQTAPKAYARNLIIVTQKRHHTFEILFLRIIVFFQNNAIKIRYEFSSVCRIQFV